MIVDDGSCYYLIAGDINHDGLADILDIIFLVDIIINAIEPNEYQLLAGDISGDGNLSILDIILLIQTINTI